MRNERMILLVSSAVLMLMGCATAAVPALQAARSEVRAAEADPLVSLYALPQLEAAERALEVAETAMGPARRRQASYLAQKHAQLALVLSDIETGNARLVATQSARERTEFAARLPAQAPLLPAAAP
jgi:hypothetical protein